MLLRQFKFPYTFSHIITYNHRSCDMQILIDTCIHIVKYHIILNNILLYINTIRSIRSKYYYHIYSYISLLYTLKDIINLFLFEVPNGKKSKDKSYSILFYYPANPPVASTNLAYSLDRK